MIEKKKPTILLLAIATALFCSLCGNLIQYINAAPKTKTEQRLSQLEYIIPDGFTHYSEDGRELAGGEIDFDTGNIFISKKEYVDCSNKVFLTVEENLRHKKPSKDAEYFQVGEESGVEVVRFETDDLNGFTAYVMPTSTHTYDYIITMESYGAEFDQGDAEMDKEFFDAFYTDLFMSLTINADLSREYSK